MVAFYCFISCSFYVPTGSYTHTSVIGQRLGADGKPIEIIRQEEVTPKQFYPATVEGPFVSTTGNSTSHYFLVGGDGKAKELKFLTKHGLKGFLLYSQSLMKGGLL